MTERRRLIAAGLAAAFLAVTTATWADVTGPGTTGTEDPASAAAPAPVLPDQPASTAEVPEAPPLEDVARDLGEREPRAERRAKPDRRPTIDDHRDWKAAKKAAKADCKRRHTGRARGQCISAAARAHKNPKARGRR